VQAAIRGTPDFLSDVFKTFFLFLQPKC